MFNTKHFTQYLLVLTVLFTGLLVTSCSDDDDDDSGCTADFVNQTATGEFMGDTYTVVEGEVEEDFADDTQNRFTLYGEAVTGDICDNFNFDKPKRTIIFSVPKAEGTYNLGVANSLSLTFNDATVVNQTEADVALCGVIEITSVTATTISGKVDVEANASSFLNGNFSAVVCN